MIRSLIDAEILNPDTLELSIGGFTTQSNKTFSIKREPYTDYDRKASLIVDQQIIAHYGSAQNFMDKLNDPIFNKLSSITGIGADSLKIASSVSGYPVSPEDLLGPLGKGTKYSLGLVKGMISSVDTAIDMLKSAKTTVKGLDIPNDVKKATIKNINDEIKFKEQIKGKLEKSKKRIEEKKVREDKKKDRCSGCGGTLGNSIFNDINHPQYNIPKPKGWQSHHIVQEGSQNPFDIKSRDLLESYDIDYHTSSANGVNLPTGKSSAKSNDFPNAINHNETFRKKEYSEKVYDNLKKSIEDIPANQVNDRKQALENSLRDMGKEMIEGNKFW